MKFVITKTINGRFTYWWNRNKNSWQGLRDNATSFSSTEANQAIMSIRKYLMYDKSVCTVIDKRH